MRRFAKGQGKNTQTLTNEFRKDSQDLIIPETKKSHIQTCTGRHFPALASKLSFDSSVSSAFPEATGVL